MFRYEYPIFEHKKILRAEMLDKLRDYPKRIFHLSLGGFGDGILCGCEMTWEENRLSIYPGLIYHKGKLYSMEERISFPCEASDQLVYVKVCFLTESKEGNGIEGNSSIRMEEKPCQKGRELELGRFQLQKGARLRTQYENLEDYATEFDTLNRIFVPYAGEGESTIWPQLLHCFGKELLETGTENSRDLSFGMEVLGHTGTIPRRLLETYVQCRRKSRNVSFSNQELYEEMVSVLRQERMGRGQEQKRQGKERSILLL